MKLMKTKNLLWTMRLYAIAAGLLIMPNAYSAEQPDKKAWFENEDTLRADLKRAIADAEIVDETEVSHTLMPIDPEDPQQEWMTIGDKRMVLVAAFMNQYGTQFYAEPDTFRIQKETGVWVALPADWKRRAAEFEGLDSVQVRMRMVQMLGLGVDCDYDQVVEFYADPDYMFRPAYDPSINTSTSATSFPAFADETYTVGETHFREWFGLNQSLAYTGKYALPWTRLGYTYDWHRGAPHEGLSEYIVSFHTLVKVKSRESCWSFIQNILQK